MDSPACQMLGQRLPPPLRVAKPTGVVEHAERTLLLEHERRKTLPAHSRQQPPALVDVILNGATHLRRERIVEHLAIDTDFGGQLCQRRAVEHAPTV